MSIPRVDVKFRLHDSRNCPRDTRNSWFTGSSLLTSRRSLALFRTLILCIDNSCVLLQSREMTRTNHRQRTRRASMLLRKTLCPREIMRHPPTLVHGKSRDIDHNSTPEFTSIFVNIHRKIVSRPYIVSSFIILTIFIFADAFVYDVRKTSNEITIDTFVYYTLWFLSLQRDIEWHWYDATVITILLNNMFRYRRIYC